MKISYRIPVLLAVVLLLCQCTQKDPEDRQAMADRSFDYLMEQVKLDHPTSTIEKLPSGMYIEWLKPKSGGTAVAKDRWLMLNYRGMDFNGQVFSTRYEDEAIFQRTHTWRTHYTPHYLVFDNNIVLSPGEKEALALMAEGDSVRLYIPTKLGFGHASINFAYGYEGWLNTGANPNAIGNVNNIPVIVELSLRDVILDPSEHEYNAMRAKASELGFTNDDKITDSLSVRIINQNPIGIVVTEKDTVYISYTARFLDGFVFKTNDPEVGVNELRDRLSEFMPLFYSAALTSSELPEEAIRKAIKSNRIRYDSEYQIIFTSIWGHGTVGVEASSTNPVVYPYTPLYFDIKTHPRGYDPDAD